MLAKLFSCAIVGLDGGLIEVEVDIAQGLPAFKSDWDTTPSLIGMLPSRRHWRPFTVTRIPRASIASRFSSKSNVPRF